MARVPRFFPDRACFARERPADRAPAAPYRTFTDGLVFVVAYPFFETVEYLQGTGILPVLVRLY